MDTDDPPNSSQSLLWKTTKTELVPIKFNPLMKIIEGDVNRLMKPLISLIEGIAVYKMTDNLFSQIPVHQLPASFNSLDSLITFYGGKRTKKPIFRFLGS